MRSLASPMLVLVLLAGCSLSGGSTTTQDDSESLVTVTKLVATSGGLASVISSDVTLTGTSDLATATFQNQPKSVSITSPSQFFGVTLTQYRVVFSRTDGGPVPAPLVASMSLFVPPPSTTTTTGTSGTGGTTTTTVGTADAQIVVVPGSAKTVPPLSDVGGGDGFTASATITFSGQDGLGRKLSTTGGIAVVFTHP